MGADVVVLEPPNGAPTRHLGPWLTAADGTRRSATHEYLDAGKRSVTLGSDELDGAFAWADLVVSSADGDVAAARARHDRIVAANPQAVHTVVSGFGLTGPYASWRSSPLADWASGGYLYLTGEPGREPLQGGGPWGSYVAGATAVIGAQAALMRAVRTGQGELVDVGAMEAVAAAHQWSITMFTHTGAVKRRWGLRFGEAFHPMGLLQCGDGNWILVGAPTREQWENFCITADVVELLADDALYAPAARFERADEIDAAVAPWLASRTADEAVREFQEHRVPASRVLSFADVLASDQLAARQVLRPRPDIGPEARTIDRPFHLAADDPLDPPPPLGRDSDAFRAALAHSDQRQLPSVDLATVRVAEFSIAWAGPLAGRILADLGADVVKVEHPASRGLAPTGGEPAREPWTWGELAPAPIRSQVFPDADPGARPWNRSGLWNKMNRSKRSLAVDAKDPDGREVVRRLLASADVVLHNYTPRGARSLGLAPDQLVEVDERLASVAMTGYGETGPMAQFASYGPMLEAYGGFDEATGYRGEGPMRLGIAFPDAVGGLHGAIAVLGALWERARRARAVHVDLSQLETLLAFAGEQLLTTSVDGVGPARHGNRSIDHAPQGVYPCAGDDRWVAITVPDDAAWARLAALLGEAPLRRADLATLDGRRAAHDELDAAIARWSTARRPFAAATQLQAIGVVAVPAFTNAELVADEHLAERGFIVEWEQPDVGRRRFPGFPIHFERSPVRIAPAPTLGQHNLPLLRELAIDEATITRMARDGVIADEPPAGP
jgi:crotonobetainyl-CoA:carnitine CoA-transferase CaiB-like acyl-CoA transferase